MVDMYRMDVLLEGSIMPVKMSNRMCWTLYPHKDLRLKAIYFHVK